MRQYMAALRYIKGLGRVGMFVYQMYLMLTMELVMSALGGETDAWQICIHKEGREEEQNTLGILSVQN